jgi:hypothetical protein
MSGWFVSVAFLNRGFEAAASNQKWIADFTYIWTAEVASTLQPSCRGLGDEGRDDSSASHRRPHHGDLAQRQAGQSAASQRAGYRCTFDFNCSSDAEQASCEVRSLYPPLPKSYTWRRVRFAPSSRKFRQTLRHPKADTAVEPTRPPSAPLSSTRAA